MNSSNGMLDGAWIWGGVWVFYALFYARYFTHVSNRLKPDLDLVSVQGSPERLRRKAQWCNRFALFMTIPTFLELLRSTYFTHAVITLAPCVFGIWVMRSIWREVFRSKIPQARQSKRHQRAAQGSESDQG